MYRQTNVEKPTGPNALFYVVGAMLIVLGLFALLIILVRDLASVPLIICIATTAICIPAGGATIGIVAKKRKEANQFDAKTLHMKSPWA